jgi:dolichyl-phosphate-mannose-protein mannosyltransferase
MLNGTIMPHHYNLRRRNLLKLEESEPFSRNRVEDSEEEEYAIQPPKSIRREFNEWYITIWLTFLSLCTRLYKVNDSPIVTWDEAHFGKFANWYIKRTFYFDVHPPLGKMLIALVAYLAGYKGDFSFDSGIEYDEEVPIREMRIFAATMGAFIVPLAYGTCRNMNMSKRASIIVSKFLLFDNALVTISKFVLLDPILLFFTVLSAYSFSKFSRHWGTIDSALSKSAKFWMLCSGVSLGLTMSVKWVGLFTYATVGLVTLKHLWKWLDVIPREPGLFGRHWYNRAKYFIVYPMMVYMFSFYAHFLVLSKSGPGDAQMPSSFQAKLEGSTIVTTENQPIVGFTSIVTLRNRQFGGGLLHSHRHRYPTGSNQTQVTLYHHRDVNNYWTVERPWKEELDSHTAIYDMEIVRLVHNETGQNLHTHQIPAPLSAYDYEVSTYGKCEIGDNKDHWIVEIVSNGHASKLATLSTVFRLKSVMFSCYLATSGKSLPDWAFNQTEVICTSGKGRNTLWNIENHVREEEEYVKELDVPSAGTRHPIREFLGDFIHLNRAMLHGNNALVPKPGKKDILTSKWYQWPFAQVGIRLCNWKDDTKKFYLLGNPIVWNLSTSSMVLFLLQTAWLLVKKRMYREHMTEVESQYVWKGLTIFSGWFLHLFPFAVMGRVTYLHHYFPALSISAMMVGHVYDGWFSSETRKSKIVFYLLVLGSFSSFIYFSPLSYGFVGNAREEMEGRKWMESWNVY